MLVSGAAPGCLLRGGGGGAKCLATAAASLESRASPEKVDSKKISKNYHNGVGVLPSWT